MAKIIKKFSPLSLFFSIFLTWFDGIFSTRVPCLMPNGSVPRPPPPSVSMSGNDGALSLCNCTLYGRYDDGLLSPCLPRHNCNSRVVSFSATEMTFAQQTTCFRLRSLELMR